MNLSRTVIQKKYFWIGCNGSRSMNNVNCMVNNSLGKNESHLMANCPRNYQKTIARTNATAAMIHLMCWPIWIYIKPCIPNRRSTATNVTRPTDDVPVFWATLKPIFAMSILHASSVVKRSPINQYMNIIYDRRIRTKAMATALPTDRWKASRYNETNGGSFVANNARNYLADPAVCAGMKGKQMSLLAKCIVNNLILIAEFIEMNGRTSAMYAINVSISPVHWKRIKWFTVARNHFSANIACVVSVKRAIWICTFNVAIQMAMAKMKKSSPACIVCVHLAN